MTDPAGWISETELHAYLDDELDAERGAAVEEFLAAHPEEAARARGYRRHTRLVARVYGPLLERPIPTRMLTALTTPTRPRAGPWPRMAAAAAAALLLFAGGAGSGWWLRDRTAASGPQEPAFVADAVTAHQVYTVEKRHPVEVEADEADHLVTWLSRRVGVSLAAPDLAGHGFELVGGRLLPAVTGPAAQLMYQDADGRRLTLYCRVSADPAETAFRFAREGELMALYWRDHGAAWVLLGELPRNELLRVAHQVYQTLHPG
ncbi:MAG TPA: anti-sigma factor [Geminicoccaceae bacterium]|nr:anti-sigma factor [Geminicoccaceae bacterium]